MRGSIKKRGATWSYVVDLGTDPTTGRRRQLYRRGFATRKAADEAMTEALAEINRGVFVRPTKGTIAEYLTGWLDSQTERVRPATIHSYRKLVNQRIVPGLGNVRLTALDAATIEAWYGRLRRSGGKDGRPLSPKTVACTAGVLHKALSDAVRLRLLRYNPATDARLPKRERPVAAAWSAGEAASFLEAVRDERLYPMWRLVLATGLRRGELLGLRWQDIDLAAGRLEVVETRTVADGEVIGPPKTSAGARVLGLDADTVAVLTAWRKRLVAERLAAGPAWTDSGRVFVDELGAPPHPETATGWWTAAVTRAGVRRIRLHDARHTAATLQLRAGVPVKVVTQRLGHADVSVTMSVYQHVTAQDDQQAADTLGRLLGGG
jgi:integrase